MLVATMFVTSQKSCRMLHCHDKMFRIPPDLKALPPSPQPILVTLFLYSSIHSSHPPLCLPWGPHEIVQCHLAEVCIACR